MLQCIYQITNYEEIDSDEIIYRYENFKRSNPNDESTELEASFAAFKLLGIIKKLKFYARVVKMINFKMLKELLILLEKPFQPVFQIEILAQLFELFQFGKSFAMMKFLVLYMSKICANAKLRRSNENLKVKVCQDFTAGDELIMLELTVKYFKITLMRDILDYSAIHQNSEETRHFPDADFATAAYLSDLLGDFKGEFKDEFQKIPLICKTFEEAEEFGQKLIEICYDGLELYDDEIDLMENMAYRYWRIDDYRDVEICLNGYVKLQIGKFATDLRRRINFFEKAIKYFDELIGIQTGPPRICKAVS